MCGVQQKHAADNSQTSHACASHASMGEVFKLKNSQHCQLETSANDLRHALPHQLLHLRFQQT
jgi:hypothetical protein